MTFSKTKTTALLLAAALTAGEPLWAEEEATLKDLITGALANNRGLSSTAFTVREAEAGIREAESRRLPALAFSAAYARLSEEDPATISVNLGPPIGVKTVRLSESSTDAVSFQLDLQYPLFSGFKISEGVELARGKTALKTREYEIRKIDLIFEVTRLFWESVRLGDSLAAIEKSLELAELHGAEVGRLAAVGLATREDRLKIEMRLAKTELLRIEAETVYEIVLLRLKNLCGLPPERRLRLRPEEGWKEPAGRSERIPDEESRIKIIGRALSDRNEIAAALELRRLREKARKIAQGDYYPSLLLLGNYTMARPNSRIFPPPSEFRDTWQVGIAAKIDIGGVPGTAARVAQAAALEDSAFNDLEALKERLALEVSEKILNLRKAELAVKVSLTLKTQAEESLRVVQEKFKSGLAKSSDVIEEQNNLLNAELAVTGSTIDRLIAEAELKRATGQLHAR